MGLKALRCETTLSAASEVTPSTCFFSHKQIFTTMKMTLKKTLKKLNLIDDEYITLTKLNHRWQIPLCDYYSF